MEQVALAVAPQTGVIVSVDVPDTYVGPPGTIVETSTDCDESAAGTKLHFLRGRVDELRFTRAFLPPDLLSALYRFSEKRIRMLWAVPSPSGASRSVRT